MRTKKQQQGMFSMGAMYLVLSLGFFVYLAFTVVPPYVDNMFIKAALEDLGESESDLATMPKSEVRSKLKKYFQINNIRGEVTEQIKIKRKDGAMIVSVDYQKRLPLFVNAELVLTFENHWNSKYPDQCCKPQTSEKP